MNFDNMALSENILRALKDVNYEIPSPIQAEAIPILLERRNLIGRAQTGTGKTAAFALPALVNIDTKQKHPPNISTCTRHVN